MAVESPIYLDGYKLVKIVSTPQGWLVYADGALDPISQHHSLANAKAAVKRYAAGDKRRGTQRRSGADTINDLTRRRM